MGVLAYFFIVMKNKSKSTMFLTYFLVLCTFFFFSYSVAASVYHPMGAYHRWVTIGVCIIAEIFMGLSLFHFPEDRNPLFGKIYKGFWYIFTPILVLYFFHDSYFSKKIFNFAGHYWDFDAEKASKIYAMVLLLSIALIFVMGVWRAFVNKGAERWAALIIGTAVFSTFMIPGVLNIFSRDGLIDRGTYQISQNLATITGVFIAIIVYLNVTKQRSTFMSKILIVSVATLLLMVQGFSYFSLQDQEKSFDLLLRSETALSLAKGKNSADMEYMINYSFPENSISTKYSKSAKENNINFNDLRQEFYNTYIYEKIKTLDKSSYKVELQNLLNGTNDSFIGYKTAILDYAAGLPSDESEPIEKILQYIDYIEKPVFFTANKIKQLPEENFNEKLKAFLPGAKSKIFNEVILEHIAKSNADQKTLKAEVLTYLTPMKKSGDRIYRKDSDDKNHFVSVMEIDPTLNTVIEAGYPYLSYRNYVHGTSKKYTILLFAMVGIIIIGFPFFFWGSLVKPIRNLISGLNEMQNGNLKVQIPIRVEDEFGFMSRNFNSMAEKISEATENLEEKVRSRTEELEAAMHEMEAINEQLIQTRDALWGEMELAKKIQTKLLPVNPEIADYDISAYMQPADEVGGDYYDIINAAGMDWIVIGDVSGHGVPAGLIMMMTQTAIHIALSQNPDIKPDNLLNIINTTISQNIKRLGEDKYMTITVLAATIGGKFMFSGLHQDIMIYRSKTGKVDYIETRGMWLGLVDDIKGMVEIDSLEMGPCDVMLLYSDGITEANKKNTSNEITDELFGEKLLGELLRSNANAPVDDLKNTIIKELKNFKCNDDVTMVILKRKC